MEALQITSLIDNVYGDLSTRGTCTTAVGTILPVSPGPGNTYTCAFTAPFTGQAGASLTDIVTVTGVDNDGATPPCRTTRVTITDSPAPRWPSSRRPAPEPARAPAAPSPTPWWSPTPPPSSPSPSPAITDDVYGDLPPGPVPPTTP